MSDDYNVQVDELLYEAAGLEDGPSKIALLEEAVRVADTHGDGYRGYEVRQQLIHTATFGGYPEKALVAFTWCLAQCDREREGRLDYTMMWKYKWVANRLVNFPQIPREQMESVFEDMAKRYRKAGAAMRAVHKIRCTAAMDMGERATAVKYHRAWQRSVRDMSSDCPACDRNHHMIYLLFLGKDEAAVEEAGPILSGAQRCAEIPHCTYARLLLPLVRLDRVAEAMTYHREGIRLIARNRAFVWELGNHIAFLAVTDNLAAGAKLLERHLAWALETADMTNRFEFYLGARLLLARLREGKRPTIRLRLPAFPAHEESGTYEIAKLADWFDTETRTLAARFDDRNGNDWFSQRVAANDELKALVVPYPVAQRRENPNAESHP